MVGKGLSLHGRPWLITFVGLGTLVSARRATYSSPVLVIVGSRWEADRWGLRIYQHQ